MIQSHQFAIVPRDGLPRSSRFPLGSVLADIRFFDDFESARMNSTTILALPSNLDGFTWNDNNKTRVVKDEWDLDPSGGREVWHNGVIDIFSAGADWRTKSGLNSLLFRYLPNEYMTEQRFSFNTAYREVWVRYWIRIPNNFNLSPTGSNNKWFIVWAGPYSGGDGASCLWEIRPETSGGQTIGAYIYTHVNQPGIGFSSALEQVNGFIRIPEDRGRWMQVVYQVKYSSTNDTYDGLFRMWRRWDGDPSLTLIHEKTNLMYRPAEGAPGLEAGYIMGWANNPYAETTEFLVDDFTVSTTSLLAV
jgi:hypothetical protein